MQEDIKKALEILRAGGVILYPTDTVWGLGCDATNIEAVKRIYEIKKRVDAKALLVLVDCSARIQSYVEEVPDMAWELIDITHKPLTIIYPDAKNLAANLLADDKSIGIRVTTESFSKTLCAQFRRPIVSTSANESGKQAPVNFNAITAEIKSLVDYVVTYRQNDASEAKPSSIIKLGKGNLFQLIRE
jgi:L-threonylcarbamoyladenylate synthase